MRTRQLAFLVLLSFIWLQLMACAPHDSAPVHGEMLSLASGHSHDAHSVDGHCHHETDSHTHDYLLAPPARPDSPAAAPVTLPVTEHSGRTNSAVTLMVGQLRLRSGRDVLLELSIART